MVPVIYISRQTLLPPKESWDNSHVRIHRAQSLPESDRREIRAPLENVPFPTAAYHSILEQQIYDTDESSVPDSVDKFVQQFALGI